ncbi:unnamed protein product [Oppiella nova]|uniref:SOCS box domain-containing protein n=1 Tax=Oppiella nova TaxID=334625 RepID=A0A7R9LB66_9ACAR|nr:unnamed protein product [Oppiella nova]CAG2161743.1 unnamed protein product [Oppiella nova]
MKYNLKQLCLQTWKCAFSHDDQLFAYSSGNSTVILVKWHQLIRNGKSDETNKRDYLEIECNHLVRSVSLSLMANLHKSTAFWHRTAHYKQYFLITGHSSGRIRIWDIQSDCVSHIECSIHGILASSSFDGTLKLWDLIDDGNLLKSIKSDGKSLLGCRWAPDFQSLITFGLSKTANVYKADTFSVSQQLSAHQHNVSAADFSPDSRLIVTVSWDTTAILWNAFNGDILQIFHQLKPRPTLVWAGGENGHFIRSVSFSPDGTHFATVADDGIWDLLECEEPAAVGTVSHGLCCTYSKSGQVLAVGTRLGSVNVFETHSSVKSLLFLCRIAIGRQLQSKSMDANTDAIPQRLINYLRYKELT